MRAEFDARRLALFIHKCRSVRNTGARGTVAVDFVVPVRETERNPAHHPPVVVEPEVTPDQSGITRQRRLRDGAETERLRGQQKITDIGPAIDRTVNAERLIGVNDGDVRCPEEIEVLERLPGIGRLVAARDAERIVELEADFSPGLQQHPAIFARKRKIAIVRRAGAGRGIDRRAETLLRRTARDHDLPRLAVAPRRRALRRRQDTLDGRARHRLRPKRAAGIAFVQQFLEHADPFFNAVPGTRHLYRCIHAHRPLVGILLNGTSLSTRMSPGRPSTRSAMMLRRISSVPPAMRTDGELSSICWNWPRASSSAAPVKTPAAPSRSIAYIAMSCSIEPVTSLPIEFSGPGRSPLDSAETAR